MWTFGTDSKGNMAKREGFEPPIPVKVCLISSQVHSTALPSLRIFRISRLRLFFIVPLWECAQNCAQNSDAGAESHCAHRAHRPRWSFWGACTAWLFLDRHAPLAS